MTPNDELVARAAAGDIEPLLARLRNAQVSPSGRAGNPFDANDDGEPPSDDLWYTVLDGWGDGELTDAQMERCREAIKQHE